MSVAKSGLHINISSLMSRPSTTTALPGRPSHLDGGTNSPVNQSLLRDVAGRLSLTNLTSGVDGNSTSDVVHYAPDVDSRFDNVIDNETFYHNFHVNGSSPAAGLNETWLNGTWGTGGTTPTPGQFSLNELQLIKVIVLVVVVIALLFSSCRVVFKTFSRYSARSKAEDSYDL